MVESALPLSSWESFYVIVGSSGAALTGLNFVVIALGAESRSTTPTATTVRAYATPTIVHFCAVLLVSALLSAPWRSAGPVVVSLAACGTAGVIYIVLITRHMVRQTQYQPVLEDWIWHTVLPLLAYAGLGVAAIFLGTGRDSGLFMVAGATLLLLFIGIHNAWDSVTWMALKHQEDGTTPK
jgi:hypothetical protein